MIGVAFTIKVTNIKEENGIYEFRDFLYHNQDSFIVAGAVVAIIGGVVVFSMLCFIAESQLQADARRAKNEQRYKLLVYEAQTESIRNEFGVSNKEYIDKVQKWNEKLAEHRAHSNNFWIGIFYPKRQYDGLDLIDLESIGIELFKDDEEYDVPEPEP